MIKAECGKQQSMYTSSDFFGNPGNDDRVRTKRIMRAVVFKTAKRDERQRIRSDGLLELKTGEGFESSRLGLAASLSAPD